jgi:tRNA dimethylallyltransferase
MGFDFITILGPTATGKTRLGARLANHFNGEIISADSRQVYKFMDIGTGKDLDDYVVDDVPVPYHLIDIAEPTDEYNLYRFQKDFSNAYDAIRDKNKFPFLVGGTGLYLSSILQNYILKQSVKSKERINELEKLSEDELHKILLKLNPKQHNITDLINRDRMIKAILIEESSDHNFKEPTDPITSLNIGIKLERNEITKRITERLKKRLDEGMIEEVKKLLQMGISNEKLAFFGLEYKYIALYLTEELNYNDMFQKLNSAIHNFAKRQMTWFRKMEREGVEINWFDGGDFEVISKFIEKRIDYDTKPA